MTSYIDGSTIFIGDFDESIDVMMLDIIDLVKRKIMVAANTAPDADPPHIEFWINSMGGDSHRAFALVDLIEWAKGAGVRVNTVVLSEAASSGSIVAVAGSKGYRRCTPGSQYMAHYGSVEISAMDPADLGRQTAVYQRHFERIHKHYTKYSNHDVTWWAGRMATDNLSFDGYEAVELGLADGFL